MDVQGKGRENMKDTKGMKGMARQRQGKRKGGAVKKKRCYCDYTDYKKQITQIQINNFKSV